MSEQDLIAALDEALFYAGELVTLSRTFGRAPSLTTASVTLPALIRGFEPSDLWPGSGLTQQDQMMVISPTLIDLIGWPGSTAGPGDPRVPRAGDRVATSRGTLTVQAAAGLYTNGTLVRIEMTVRGT